MKANEILAIGNDIFTNANGRKSIYKNEIFVDCKTDRDKKNLRMKLRKKLDNFIAEYISSMKNKEKLNQLKKAWKDYSKMVYLNAECIVDANANTEKKKSIEDFLKAMNEKESTVK